MPDSIDISEVAMRHSQHQFWIIVMTAFLGAVACVFRILSEPFHECFASPSKRAFILSKGHPVLRLPR